MAQPNKRRDAVLSPESQPFVRDSFTWLAYLMLGYFAYLQAAIGPLMPFLRVELHLNYVVGGLHVSAFALGMIIAGLFGESVSQRFGRRTAFWLGGFGMAVGAMCLAFGVNLVFTLLGTLVMGTFGSLLVIMIQATLSDKYQQQRSTALTESNILGSIGAGLAPALIGVFAFTIFGWRTTLYAAVAIVLLLALVFWRVVVPAGQREAQVYTSTEMKDAASQLPLVFWVYWIALVCCVAAEWCISVWTVDFLHTAVGLSTTAATFTLSIYFVTSVIGRFTGSRLTRIARSSMLLLFALAIACIGFPLYWLSPTSWLNLLGLFVAGIGVANLFPLTISVATSTAPELADRASARLSLGAGLAIFLAPFVLAWAADTVGIQHAFALVAVLLVLAVSATLTANRLSSPAATG